MKTIKFIIRLVIIVAVSFWAISSVAYIFWSRTPKFSTYEEQKNFGYGKHPEIMANDLAVILFHPWYWNSKLKSHLATAKHYSEEANSDIDVLRWTARCYWELDYTKKALEYYKRELDVFNKKYFKKEYPEKTKLKPGEEWRVERAEYLRIFKIHSNIASCYWRLGQPEKAIEEYQYIISHYSNMPTQNSSLDRFDVIGKAYEKLGFIYKNLKEYDRSIEYFNKIINEFPRPSIQAWETLNIGDVYLAKGDKKKAKEIFKEIIEKYKDAEPGFARMAENRLKKLQEY